MADQVMLYLAIAFLVASLGLSGLVIVWGIAWAARPRPRKSVIPETVANISTYPVFLRSGQLYDSEF